MLSSYQKAAYSLATFGNAIIGAIFTVFTFYFYKNIVYENLIEVNEPIILTLLGTALAIGWWVQALMNPVAGWLSDKMTSLRFGRRKPWLFFGSPIIALSFIGIFIIPTPATDILFPIIWLTLFAAIYNGAFASTVVVYLAMIPEIAFTPEERTSISSYRQIFFLLGNIIGVLLGSLVSFEIFIVIILAAFFVIFFYFAAFNVPEARMEIPKIPTYGILEALKITFQNKPFLPYLGYTIFATAFQSMLIGSLPDFGLHVAFKGKENIIASLIASGFVITAILAVGPAMLWINKIGKKKAVIYSMSTAIVITPILATVGLIPGLELIQTILIVLILGIPAAPLLILPDSIISDITDYDEIITGKRREAMHFAAQGLLTRFSGGIAIQMMGIILGLFGATYNVNEPFNGTLGLLLIGPIASLILLIGLIIFLKYPEDEVIGASAKRIKH